MSSTSPNMLLVVPDPGVTLGPAWAQQIADALERIDLHNHTPNLGVALSSQSITVDGDLSLQAFNLTGIRTLRLNSQLSTPVTANDLQIVYSMGGELFYRDDAGNAVQLTNGGSIAGTAGTIANLGTGGSSANFNDGTDTFTFLYSPSKPGKFAHADLELYPYDGTNTYTNNVSIKVNTTLSGDYDFILPDTLPVRTSTLLVSSVGQVSSVTLNNGQFLIGSTSGAPLAASLSGVANQIVITAGANTLAVSLADEIAVSLGTAALPAYSFLGDLDTGIYSPGPNTLAASTNGVLRWYTDTGSLVLTNSTNVLLQDGSPSAPGIAFLADQDTGIYRAGTNNVNIVAGGTAVLQISASGVFTFAENGSSGSPSYGFQAQSGLGFYRHSAGRIGAAGDIVATGSLETASGGAFKVKVIAVSGTAAFISVAHGLTRTKITGIEYAIEFDGSGRTDSFVNSVTQVSATSTDIFMNLSGSMLYSGYITVTYTV